MQKKKYKIIILIYIVFLISILILINILFNKYKKDCINWPKGLNNTFLDNNSVKYGLSNYFPKEIHYTIFTNFLEHTKVVRKKISKNIYG